MSKQKEIVATVESVLLPEFDGISQLLSGRYKAYGFRVFSDSGGNATSHPWQVLGVECLLHKDWENQPNTVSLQVDVYSLKTVPEIWAGVVWDYSEKPPEYSLFKKPVLFSDQTLEIVKQALPDLLENFETAIKRWSEKRMDYKPAS